MKPTVEKALTEWKEAFDRTHERAADVLTLALPGLAPNDRSCYCCPLTLRIDQPNAAGAGKVCVDNDHRATVELDDVPNDVIAEGVDELFGIAWFDGADGPLADAGPGMYAYDDETTCAEYEIVLGKHGVGRVYAAYVPVGYAVELLDALTTARERQAAEKALTAGPGQ
ncbi:hypothetical protein ACFWRZ_08930 [Streptomyces rubiginosohelvolus]|uniref:hypothetical protein n=1 Tax=Streptomyces TaxID=1883 RepID=UPI0033EEA2FD